MLYSPTQCAFSLIRCTLPIHVSVPASVMPMLCLFAMPIMMPTAFRLCVPQSLCFSYRQGLALRQLPPLLKLSGLQLQTPGCDLVFVFQRVRVNGALKDEILRH